MSSSMANEGRHYQVLSVLGRGGFGTVYRARLSTEGGFSKLVALKVLNPDMEGMAEMAQRMRDEARLLGMVNHRAIVQVDALVLLDGKWTVVMEYVEGSDVKSLMTKGPMALGPALEVTRELGSALDFAYNAAGPDGTPLKLVHRDIKPGNVRITPVGEVKLLDFGIARADFQAREARTRSLSFGTPDYMAPERFEFVDGPEGDVYAVGVLLYEMLTGEHFGQTSPAQERHDARVMGALDKLWQATQGRSEDVVRFIGAMLAFDPAARPTAREVERRCLELWRALGDQTLRDWVEAVLPTITQAEEEAAPGDLASRKLTENIRSGAIPYPTEKLADPALPPPPPISSATPPVAPLPKEATPPMPPHEDHYNDHAPPPKKGGMGLWIVLALFLFLVLGGGAGLAGWYGWKTLGGGAEGGEGGEEGGGEEGGDVATNVGDDGTGTTTGDVKSTDGTTTTSADTKSTDGTTTTSADTKSADGTTTTSADTKTTTSADTKSADGTTTTSADTKATDTKTTTSADTKTTTSADTKATDTKATTSADTKATDTKTADVKVKPRTGKVVVAGDARVRLNRGGTSVAPSASVEPGTYQLEYTIPGQPTKQGGRVVVTAGDTVTIVCSRGTKTCTVR